jgi:hypothetical protein
MVGKSFAKNIKGSEKINYKNERQLYNSSKFN